MKKWPTPGSEKDSAMPNEAASEALLSVRDLGVVYETSQGPVHAVTDVSFDMTDTHDPAKRAAA